MIKGKIFGYFFVITLVLTSCKTASINPVSKTDIREIINSSEVILVDVRIPEQYEAGTAKGAINIPLAEIQSNLDSLKGKKVVVFCNKGIQADQAMEILKKNGVEAYDGTSLQNVKAIQNEKPSGK
ncbi:rhodanese-like domain-containing protein [Chryseobacterium shigense]|uniref:Rhodanese-related sulfurtransferase n=1 Tax=Chryseobacterium shigense TaxID=297244 RepID=A0A841NGK9_9FLAO|nr:rhodanese-like domain-containing protein [Chryseobacterium shigense]MBB6371132.1 rhodanese-related sulfurtransferase [Chryseobacterium shigense]